MLFTYRKNDDTQKADGNDDSKGPEVTGEVVIGKLLNLHQEGPVNTHTHGMHYLHNYMAFNMSSALKGSIQVF